MQGSVYILTNVSMPGLIKVGYTTRSVSQRIDELAHTGHPTRFFCELEIVTDQPELLESNLHGALYKFHYQKEFFKCDLVTAVKVIKEHLESTNLTVSYISGRAKDLYVTESEKLRIEQNQERLKLEALEREKKLIADQLKNRQREKYLQERVSFYWKEFSQNAYYFRLAVKYSIPLSESAWNSETVSFFKGALLPIFVLGSVAKETVLPSKTDYQVGLARRERIDKIWLGACDKFSLLRRKIIEEDFEIYRRLYFKFYDKNPRERFEYDRLDIESEYALGLMGLKKGEQNIFDRQFG